MEFTNDILVEMKDKKQFNVSYSKYYYRLSKEYLSYDLPLRSRKIDKKSNKILDCMNLWQWDVYNENKIMDLQKVNRCMDSRFCPNCRSLNLSSAIHNLRPAFSALLAQNYYPYLLTLTIPNVQCFELRQTIEKLNKSFTKFNDFLSRNDRHCFKGRYMRFSACLKCIEITYNAKDNTYHPHFHCIIFSDSYFPDLLEKKYPGPYRRKSHDYIKYSDMDMQLMKLWKICFDGLSVKEYNCLKNDWKELYQCDFREMDEHGIYEVLKYTFKDTDIKNYDVFKTFFIALEGKRIRQGYGLLYNVKVDDDADGEKQELELEIKENPQQLLTREINDLITVYADYKKVSRFKAYEELREVYQNN